MNIKKKLAAGALATVMGATTMGLVTAAPAQAASGTYKCKVSKVGLSWGRPYATSSCKKSKAGKKVRKHRVILVCDVVRGTGAGAEHTIPWTVWGPWKTVGKKSTINCGPRSFFRSAKVEIKK